MTLWVLKRCDACSKDFVADSINLTLWVLKPKTKAKKQGGDKGINLTLWVLKLVETCDTSLRKRYKFDPLGIETFSSVKNPDGTREYKFDPLGIETD